MKILHIDNSLGTGGAEKLILDTVPLYRKAGIEVDVLLLVDNDFLFAKELKKLDCCNVFIIRKSKNEKDVYNPFFIFKIRKYLKNYDIAHLHVFPSQYYAVFANLLNGNTTKLILTEHNTTNGRIKKKILKPLEKFIYSKYEKIICITHEIKLIYQNYLGLTDQLVTINNGVDICKINEAQPYEKSDLGYSEQDILVSMFARFTKQKDHETVIKALLYLPENVKLLLAGDGALRVVCENLVKELNLIHRVSFLGVRNDVPELLKTSDIIVLSSHYEGLSLSSIEGMASGKPFIASDVPGVSETVKDAGILFPAGNEKKLAEEILKLLNDKDYYNDVALKCVKHAMNYDIYKMVEKYIKLYQSVLSK
jgi:glycosyltransferase involved in cell wall biosynthesis